jgi:histidyl-tRNA synthetase
LSECHRRGAEQTVLLGSREAAAWPAQLALRDMRSGEQKTVSFDEAVSILESCKTK